MPPILAGRAGLSQDHGRAVRSRPPDQRPGPNASRAGNRVRHGAAGLSGPYSRAAPADRLHDDVTAENGAVDCPARSPIPARRQMMTRPLHPPGRQLGRRYGITRPVTGAMLRVYVTVRAARPQRHPVAEVKRLIAGDAVPAPSARHHAGSDRHAPRRAEFLPCPRGRRVAPVGHDDQPKHGDER